jgi:large subunit ribosomal protein L19
MKNILNQLEHDWMVQTGKTFQPFRPGDTVSVSIRIKEGERERLQLFEGLLIGMRRAGIRSSIRVLKITHDVGVERIFPLYSPSVSSITLVKTGKARRAKLYYMRTLRGKAARLKETYRMKKYSKKQGVIS